MDAYENDDVEIVFDSLDAAAKQQHQQLLASFWRDGMTIRQLDEYNGAMWDPTNYPAEARGTWPREYADEVPR